MQLEGLQRIPARQKAACLKIAQLVQAAGGRAYLVGGAVRDAFLGRPIKDLDLEVFGLHPDALLHCLQAHFVIDPVGQHFGVLIVKGFNIDIAVPRKEISSGPKHTDFLVEYAPNSTLAEAASRRDFTINAVSYDLLSDALHDPYDGLQDLQVGRLRHVSQKFAEDSLRVLRAMQFIARFDLEPDPSTLQLCRQLSPKQLPIERIESEWKKIILQGVKIGQGLQFLMDCGWLHYFPELAALDACQQDPQWHPEGSVWVHTRHCMDAFALNRIEDAGEDFIVGLAVLCHDLGKPLCSYQDAQGRIRSPQHDRLGVPQARRFLQRITRQKALIDAVLPLVEHHMRPHDFYRQQAGDAAIRRLAVKVKRIDRLVRVAQADANGRPPLSDPEFAAGRWLQARAQALAVQASAPQPLVMGRHLIQLGCQPGPQFKSLLEQCYQAQLDGHFSDQAGGLAFVQRILLDHVCE
jgi:tRNA nucleotidyltransferase (CCA-adding enzyme)